MTRSLTIRLAVTIAVGSLAMLPASLLAQDTATDTVVVTQLQDAPGGLPVAVTLGMGWGIRTDPCTACASPENTSSFTAHLAVAKPLHRGLGVGVDVSVWRRSHPGPFGADTALVDQPSTLVNMLVNASVTFSYEVSYLWVRGGVGPALSRTDVLEDDGSGTEIKAGASGMGVGYTLGAGVRMPLAGPISLAFFANWNAGGYDLSTARAVVARGAKHEYLELGMGIALR